jgi:hypothetical protein
MYILKEKELKNLVTYTILNGTLIYITKHPNELSVKLKEESIL